MNRWSWVKITLIGLATIVFIWWNTRVFSIYSLWTVPITFTAMIFTMIAITIVRSRCTVGRRRHTLCADFESEPERPIR